MYQMLNIPLNAEDIHTWHNLLKFPLYARKDWIHKHLDKIISALKTILSDKNAILNTASNNHLMPWDAIGFICLNDNLYQEAEKIYDNVYRKFLDIKADATVPLYNRGIARFLQGRYKDAYEDFKLARKSDPHFYDKGSLTYGAIKYMDEVLFPTRETIRHNQEKLVKDLNMPKMLDDVAGPNKLKIIRKWNSSTPLYSQAPSLGGGYYLTLKNARGETKGIVIDPGYNFMEIFREQFLGILDIDAIIITHDHDDHSEAIEGILSLVAKYNDYKLKGPTKSVDIFGSPGVMLKYQGIFNKTDRDGNKEINFQLMIPGNRLTEIDGMPLMDKFGFEIIVNQAYHPELWTNQESAVGLTLETNITYNHHPLKLGITGDTRYETFIGNQYQDSQILLINIGSIEKEEGKLLHSHLGLCGCINLLKEARLGKQLLAILTEFGEEFRGRRKIISRIIELWAQPMEQSLINPEFRVVPADLNLEVDLNDLSIKETKSGKFHPYPDIDFDELDMELISYKRKQ
jgi:tetratricopeptide (TPR) repeat protein